MPWFSPKSKKKLEEIQVSQLRFVGEQDGPPERELKGRLAQFFRQSQTVNKAYLARVEYGNKSVAVALCLCSQFGPACDLAEKIGKIFASMFGRHEHLDIVFLTEAQEAELVMVCKPFFRASDEGQ